MEYNTEILTQFIQLIQVKTVGLVTSKQVNSRFKSTEQTATLYNHITDHKKPHKFVLRFKLLDYILGVYSLTDTQLDV